MGLLTEAKNKPSCCILDPLERRQGRLDADSPTIIELQ